MFARYKTRIVIWKKWKRLPGIATGKLSGLVVVPLDL